VLGFVFGIMKPGNTHAARSPSPHTPQHKHCSCPVSTINYFVSLSLSLPRPSPDFVFLVHPNNPEFVRFRQINWSGSESKGGWSFLLSNSSGQVGNSLFSTLSIPLLPVLKYSKPEINLIILKRNLISYDQRLNCVSITKSNQLLLCAPNEGCLFRYSY
jgi:hypothetical protein